MSFSLEDFESQGRRKERPVKPCPECGGPAEVNESGNRWRCFAFERDGLIKISVCNASGVLVRGEMYVTRGSNGLWRELVTEEG